MRASPLAPALALALVTAGCTAAEPLGLSDGDTPREPYYKDYRETVAPHTERAKLFPVEEGALLANVSMVLTQRDSGLPLPEAAPARVHFEVIDPAGRVLGADAVDARDPFATIVLSGPTPGDWTVRLTGTGATGVFEDASYAAEYVLSVEVVYG